MIDRIGLDGTDFARPRSCCERAPAPLALTVATEVTRAASDGYERRIRVHDHPHDDGAFLLAPDGRDVEAVCHRPEPA